MARLGAGWSLHKRKGRWKIDQGTGADEEVGSGEAPINEGQAALSERESVPTGEPDLPRAECEQMETVASLSAAGMMPFGLLVVTKNLQNDGEGRGTKICLGPSETVPDGIITYNPANTGDVYSVDIKRHLDAC